MTPIFPEASEHLFTTSTLLKTRGVRFEQAGERTWQLIYKGRNYPVTFRPEVFDDISSVRLMSFGDLLFEELLGLAMGGLK